MLEPYVAGGSFCVTRPSRLYFFSRCIQAVDSYYCVVSQGSNLPQRLLIFDDSNGQPNSHFFGTKLQPIRTTKILAIPKNRLIQEPKRDIYCQNKFRVLSFCKKKLHLDRCTKYSNLSIL